MLSESIDEAVQRLLAEAAEAAAAWSRKPGRVRVTSVDKPEIDELLSEELRSALEDEVVSAREADKDGGISQYDVDQEVVKKALVGLKLSTLRTLAKERSLSASGGAEVVAERIGRAYRWDRAAVAKLVLEYEEEPSPERGHVTRLFPVREFPQPEVREQLGALQGRYIRIGVARWFVFESVTSTAAGSVYVQGSYRAYSADVEDSFGDPQLTSVASDASASAWVREDNDFVRVDAKSAAAARACAAAIRIACDLTARPGLSLTEMDGEELEPHSAFMVDLLINRFRLAGFVERNLTVTKFRVGDDRELMDDEESVRPALRAVSFEGEHLLDSPVACELLAVHRRPLVDMSLSVRVRSDDGSRIARFPIRVAHEAGNVLVATGYGAGDPELSSKAHALAFDAVRDELRFGFLEEARLIAYAGRIRAIAEAEQTPQVATMLADEDEVDLPKPSPMDPLEDGSVDAPPSGVAPLGGRPEDVQEETGLSTQVVDILALVGRGHSNAQIATTLGLSPTDVKADIRDAYSQLGIKTREQAVLWAIEHGLAGSELDETTPVVPTE